MFVVKDDKAPDAVFCDGCIGHGDELSHNSGEDDLCGFARLAQLPRPLGYYDMSETDIDRYNAKWADSVFAFPFNISGQSAISLPLGWSKGGVPIGVQLVGRHGDEATVLAASAQLEQEMPWKGRRPPSAL